MPDFIVSTEPAEYPLSLSVVQSYLRLDTQDDLDVVIDLIAAATSLAEQHTNRTFISTEYIIYYDKLPNSRNRNVNFLRLTKGEILNVSNITLTFDDDTTETLSGYLLTNTNTDGKVWPNNDDWGVTSSLSLKAQNAVAITYTAGYGINDTKIPAGIKNVLLQMIAFMYENREGDDIPESIMNRLNAFRVVVV